MSVRTRSTTFWLAFKPKGYFDMVGRMAKRKPALAKDEVAIEVTVDLPASLFEKPTLAAKIVGTGEAPRLDLTPEFIANIEEHLEAQTGLRIELVPQASGDADEL